MFRRAGLGVLPSRHTARDAQTERGDSLLERSSVVRETGSALVDGTGADVPQVAPRERQRYQTRKRSGIPRQRFRARITKGVARESDGFESRANRERFTERRRRYRVNLVSFGGERHQRRRSIAQTRSERCPSLGTEPTLDEPNSGYLPFATSETECLSERARALRRHRERSSGVDAHGDTTEPLAGPAAGAPAANTSRCSGETRSSIAEESGTVTKTGGSAAHSGSSYSPRDASSRLEEQQTRPEVTHDHPTTSFHSQEKG